MAAAPSLEGGCVNMDLARIAARIRSHPWVDDAQCGDGSVDAPGALVALNTEGVDALLRQGRAQLVDTFQVHLNSAGYAGAPLIWRLFDDMPMLTSPQQIDALLQSPLPRDASLLEEHQHDGQWTLALRIPLDLIYFPGHFPQAPILPGAVQVAWALAFATTRLGTPLRCHVIEALKFQQLLRPGDRADLTLRHDLERHKLHFAYRYGEKAYSSGRLAWSATS
jgi:3-hydroxymyristoyl/3-hydroxydecanoyl-(acyl carrier protein) dehydratase